MIRLRWFSSQLIWQECHGSRSSPRPASSWTSSFSSDIQSELQFMSRLKDAQNKWSFQFSFSIFNENHIYIFVIFSLNFWEIELEYLTELLKNFKLTEVAWGRKIQFLVRTSVLWHECLLRDVMKNSSSVQIDLMSDLRCKDAAAFHPTYR